MSLGIACGLPCQVLQLSTLNDNDYGGRLNHDDDDDDDNDDDEEAEDDDDDDDEDDDDDDDHDDHNDDYDEVMSFCSDDVYPLCWGHCRTTSESWPLWPVNCQGLSRAVRQVGFTPLLKPLPYASWNMYPVKNVHTGT